MDIGNTGMLTYAKELLLILGVLFAFGKYVFIPRAKAFVHSELQTTNKLAITLERRIVSLEHDTAGTKRAVEKLGDEMGRGLERITITMNSIAADVSKHAIKTAELVGELKGRREATHHNHATDE